MNIATHIPSDPPVFSPIPISTTQFITPDVVGLANGDDGMTDDFATAAAAADAEAGLLALDTAALGLIESDSLLGVLDQVNATGVAIGAFQATGDGLMSDIAGITPPPDPGASAPPQNTPAPPGTTGGGAAPGGGGGGGGASDCTDTGICNGCYEGDEPGCFVF